MALRQGLLLTSCLILLLHGYSAGEPHYGPLGQNSSLTLPEGENLVRLGNLGTLPFEKTVWLYAGQENKIVFSSSNGKYFMIFVYIANEKNLLKEIRYYSQTRITYDVASGTRFTLENMAADNVFWVKVASNCPVRLQIEKAGMLRFQHPDGSGLIFKDAKDRGILINETGSVEHFTLKYMDPFILPGRYRFLRYEDLNENWEIDKGERFQWYRQGEDFETSQAFVVKPDQLTMVCLEDGMEFVHTNQGPDYESFPLAQDDFFHVTNLPFGIRRAFTASKTDALTFRFDHQGFSAQLRSVDSTPMFRWHASGIVSNGIIIRSWTNDSYASREFYCIFDSKNDTNHINWWFSFKPEQSGEMTVVIIPLAPFVLTVRSASFTNQSILLRLLDKSGKSHWVTARRQTSEAGMKKLNEFVGMIEPGNYRILFLKNYGDQHRTAVKKYWYEGQPFLPDAKPVEFRLGQETRLTVDDPFVSFTGVSNDVHNMLAGIETNCAPASVIERPAVLMSNNMIYTQIFKTWVTNWGPFGVKLLSPEADETLYDAGYFISFKVNIPGKYVNSNNAKDYFLSINLLCGKDGSSSFKITEQRLRRDKYNVQIGGEIPFNIRMPDKIKEFGIRQPYTVVVEISQRLKEDGVTVSKTVLKSQEFILTTGK
jgi:hypothetical protein